MRVQIHAARVEGRIYFNVVPYGSPDSVLFSSTGRASCMKYAKEQGWKVVSG